MVVIENEDNLILFSFAYIPYDIKDIKLVSKPFDSSNLYDIK